MATKKYVSLSGLSNFLNNLKNLFATKTEMNAKSDKTHTHTIADITNLQSTLNGKAASSHGTHVSYSTAAPVMDGAASVGSASTVARSDHRHPTDTSRASQTDLDALETVVAGKANSSHTHQYAGSPSAGGDANNALKLQGYTRSNLYADLPTWINSVGLSHMITVEGDKDTYYPVRIYLPSSKTMPTYISIHKNLGTKTPDVEGNHSNGTSSMWLIYEGRNRSWDGNGGYLKTWYRYMGYANLCAHADIGASAVGDLIVWLRGGGCTYEISKTNGSAESTIYYEETNIGTEAYPYIVSPRKDLGNKGVYSGTLGYGNIEGNATTSTKATQDGNGNVIASTYETKTDASNKLATAKTYADSAATTAATKVKNDLLNGAGGAYDTLKELGDLIDDNTDAIDALEIVAAGKADKSHTHAVSDVTNLQTNLSNIQTQIDGKAASSHSHSISNVSNLQSILDGKSSSSHTHYYAGSSIIGGGANALAIADTRNVNDTPTEMTNLIGGKGARLDFKGTSTVGLSNGTYAAVLSISPWGDTTNWSGGKNTQLGFCDDGRIQVRKGNGSGWSSWNTIIDSSTIGNQSVKYATSAGSSTKATQDAGGNIIASTYATKTELDTAKSTLQTSINGKANSSHTHTIANITNLQTTLDGKAASSHNHSATNITSGTLSSDRLSTVPIAKGGTGATTSAGALTNLGITATAAELNKLDGVTATAAELNYVDGVTSNIQTQLNGKAASGHTHNKDTINSVSEAKIEWGGRNISGSVSPIDAAASNLHSANRFSFAKAAGITIEYSTNGSTYSTYATTDSAKVNLVSGIGSAYYIGARTSSTTVNDKLRITLNATNMGLYTRLQKLLVNISTNYATGSNVIIEKAMKGSETTYTTVGTYQISGWSGWNSIPISAAFGGGDTQTYNIANLRLTFGITGVNSSQTSNALTITDIIGIGDTYWSYPSTMAKTGHLYSYDSSQNATFPANVTANTFVGALSGNSATATKFSSAKTISLTGDVTGSTSFDGSGNVSITATVADDSHNHVISNVDGLQSALDGKSATSHTHTADNLIQWAEALFGTNSGGGVEYSYGSGSGKNVLTEISNMPQGLHTIYAISGTTGNPKTNESFRFLIHKTSGTIGWILAWDAQGSLFTNYQSAAGTFKGWKCVYDANPSALWTGGYYMSSSNSTPQTVTPSKKLSECRNGWVLVWSDYDPDTSTKNNTDIHHDYVFKKNCAGANWSGQCMLCDIPRYMGSNAQDVDTERRILKAIYIHDDRIEGSYQGSYDERNDVILRAVYEF